MQFSYGADNLALTKEKILARVTSNYMQPKETIVMSVGGSLIVPDQIDHAFLASLKKLVLKYIKRGERFVIITGGGRTAREYQKAADELTNLTKEDIDWLGIHATRLNAQLLRAIFYKQAHPVIIKDPTRKITTNKEVIIAAGWKPGWSTDYDAVLLGKNLKARRVINLSNINYVYDKDPRRFPDAKPFKKMSWSEIRAILPKKWDPGLNAPFDPIAAKEAERLKLEVAIINGKKLAEVEKYLDGKPFTGTVIK
jgi:uridylate kinase